MNSLPGWAYQGAEPDGFAPAAEFANSLARYAGSFHAPVVEGAEVQDLRMTRGMFEVITAVGAWRARNVILATGWCDLPRVPSWARDLHRSMSQVTPTESTGTRRRSRRRCCSSWAPRPPEFSSPTSCGRPAAT
jgi:putative flavoprotein involved in K+ transport